MKLFTRNVDPYRWLLCCSRWKQSALVLLATRNFCSAANGNRPLGWKTGVVEKRWGFHDKWDPIDARSSAWKFLRRLSCGDGAIGTHVTWPWPNVQKVSRLMCRNSAVSVLRCPKVEMDISISWELTRYYTLLFILGNGNSFLLCIITYLMFVNYLVT